ncbi:MULTISPECIES: APC family permease [unclassified Arthrobacter]|uniref:APC family permease n=1 Tax=unclassified Arthrobacter TaxID=235627 RepID=UPI00159D7CCE|nr:MULTISPECIES: APC family permease [unclassified Arthrobacter]MCQ9164077.1 APC family permease [Arthrobacter sp. STN4]NVM97873.1 APC family permease [Arthrobacter sp. SDTb3-6]
MTLAPRATSVTRVLNFFNAFKRVLVGRPFRNDKLAHTLLPKRIALPIFASDALSSVAYAPDEILLTLALAGVASVALAPWVGLAVMVVLLTVVASYRQNVHAYPSGGGDYEIANVNLGKTAGLTVASALMVDYVLTVAVSMSSAANYLATAVPGWHGTQAVVAVIGVIVLALVNLRGIREAGSVFAVPTYIFMFCIFAMTAVGLFQAATGTLGRAPSAGFEIIPEAAFSQGLTGLAGGFLLLRAFSSGAAALTGVEAISNGVPNFRKPKSKNAATTLLLLGAVAAGMMAGILFLANATGVHIVADPATEFLQNGHLLPAGYVQNPSISQIAGTIFGAGSIPFFIVVAATGVILVFASNTAFNGFPVLASILARDGYLPRQLRTRGDRLAFSNGVILLAVGALVLIISFDADVTKLIQLYIVGVFISFTASQLGMVRHWTRELRVVKDKRIRFRMVRSRTINSLGFLMTLTVLLIVLVTKFEQGAWIALLAMGVLFAIMWSIRAHYDNVAKELAVETDSATRALPARIHAVILVSHVRKPVMRAVAFARASRPSSLEAITVDLDAAETEQTIADWDRLDIPVPLTVLASPYRETLTPLINHIKTMRRDSPRDLIVVYIPEYVVGKWWEQLVHNQTALRIKTRLHFEPGVVVASVPWQLKSSTEAQKYQD